jgi:catalytic LigB subunit of aromatic ring-opening dioxygenase
MAEIVLGIGTSHTPLLVIPPEKWHLYARDDAKSAELVCPPDGVAMTYAEAVEYRPAEIRDKPRDLATFQAQSARCTAALDAMADTLAAVDADITVIVSDDQDEWFFDDNMPCFSVYWGDTAPLRPRTLPPRGDAELSRMIVEGYGAVARDVPVAAKFGRHLIEYLMARDFDLSHFTYVNERHGGRVARRYPTRTGELDSAREIADRVQGLPHGYSFVLTRLLAADSGPILPVFQNTCYPPNVPSAGRCFDLGRAIGDAIRAWDEPARVAVLGSGGLSHFVVDEELDRRVLAALELPRHEDLTSLSRRQLRSGTSEILNWVAAAGCLGGLRAEVIDYIAGYRSPAGTGAGMAFAWWHRR